MRLSKKQTAENHYFLGSFQKCWLETEDQRGVHSFSDCIQFWVNTCNKGYALFKIIVHHTQKGADLDSQFKCGNANFTFLLGAESQYIHRVERNLQSCTTPVRIQNSYYL